MLIYEKKVTEGTSQVRHLFKSIGNAPTASDTQLTYVDDDGSSITVDPVHGKYFDDKKGGIIDEEGSKVVVKAGDEVLIPKDYVIPVVDHIEVGNDPTKKNYVVGEKLSVAGIRVDAEYTDGKIVPIRKKELTFSPAEGYEFKDTDISTEKTITVTYNGKTAEFTVTVTEAEAEG